MPSALRSVYKGRLCISVSSSYSPKPSSDSRIPTHHFLTPKSSFLTPFDFPFSRNKPSMLYFRGNTCRNLVPAAGLEPARPIKPRDFKSLVSTIPPRGQKQIESGTYVNSQVLESLIGLCLSIRSSCKMCANVYQLCDKLGRKF